MIRIGTLAAGCLCLWFVPPLSAADLEPESTLKGHKEPIRSVAFTPDGKFVVSTAYKEVRLWDLAAGTSQLHNSFGQYEYLWGTPRLSADGKVLAIGSTYYNSTNVLVTGMRLFKISDKIEPGGEIGATATTDYEHDTVPEIAFSPGGKMLAAVHYNGSKKKYTLSLHDVETLQALNTDVHSSDSALKIAFTPDGKTLVSADANGNVILWKASTGKQRATTEIHKSAINDLAIDADSKTLATAGDDKTVKLFDLEKGELKMTLTGHDDAVLCVTYAKGGKYLASGGKDHNVKIWDAVSGKELANIEAHLNHVTCLAFSPDGKTLVTGGADKYVRLWDVAKAIKAKK
jgi:WD40 repeat protein